MNLLSICFANRVISIAIKWDFECFLVIRFEVVFGRLFLALFEEFGAGRGDVGDREGLRALRRYEIEGFSTLESLDQGVKDVTSLRLESKTKVSTTV